MAIPSAHSETHARGGRDVIKLDDLGQPDDNADLNANTLRHGLMPKLSGDPGDALRGDGTFGATGSGLAAAAWMVCGRLTTESGVPVSTTDRTAQSTIYFTPYNGDSVPLYTGSAWTRLAFAEISLALSGLTSGKNYDVFVYNNSGTLALELSAAWTNDTTRADALALQNGLYVKSGATTRLHVGTIRTTNTTTTEDSAAKRFVWNAYNRIRRAMKAALETAGNWNYTSATYRQANANTANQLMYVAGGIGDAVEARVYAIRFNSNNNINAFSGVGVDSTTVNSAAYYGGNASSTVVTPGSAEYIGTPGIGYHFLAWLESSQVSGTMTWVGSSLSGIVGSVWN